jgi:hypothetical protein
MSTFCGGNGNIPAMTKSEMQLPYTPPSGGTAFLPTPLPSLNENGLVNDAILEQYVNNLRASNRIPKLPILNTLASSPGGSPDSREPLANYTATMKSIASQIKSEYCFYESQYFAAVDAFLQSIADASITGKGSESVQSNLDIARKANQRVTVFTQVVNAISKYNYAQTQSWNTEINSMNQQFSKNAAGLKEQSDILNNSTAAADLNKRMISYTLEKNKANTNLLSLYTILNASAIAMLIYISRSQ